jgi:hypothetical protein
MSLTPIASTKISVDPNTSTYVTVYTVPPGQRLKLKKIQIWFPVGTYSELQVKILWGWTSLAPLDGYFTGDELLIEKDVEAEYGSQSNVVAYLRNLNTANKRECTITLLGELA